MTSTPSTGPALALLTAPARKGAAAATAAAPRLDRPASAAHRALEARRVGCFG